MGSYFLNSISYCLCRLPPISFNISISPSWFAKFRFTNFISKIHTNNPWIIFISFSYLLQASEKFFLRIFIIPPQSISIMVRAAPLRFACMIIKIHHQSLLSQSLNCRIKNLDSCLSKEIRVAFYQLSINEIILSKQLQRKSQSDRIHSEFMTNFIAHLSQRTFVKASNTVSLHMTTRPISARQFYSSSSRVDNFHVFCRQRKFNIFNIKQGLL